MIWPSAHGRPLDWREFTPEQRRAFGYAALTDARLDLDDDTLARIYAPKDDEHETS